MCGGLIPRVPLASKVVRVEVPEGLGEEDVRLAVAVEAFRRGLVSVSKAAELAGLPLGDKALSILGRLEDLTCIFDIILIGRVNDALRSRGSGAHPLYHRSANLAFLTAPNWPYGEGRFIFAPPPWPRACLARSRRMGSSATQLPPGRRISGSRPFGRLS